MSNREEQIYKAADKATYQTPPQYSELVHKSRKVMCAYETGFIDGCVWADSHPNWISVEDEPYPPKKNKWDKKSEEVLIYGLWMGRPTRLFGTYHYDINEWGANGLISNITHWMEIQPPRKEE